MILGLPIVLSLAQQCAPEIAPEAIASVASAESGFDPLAINVNRVGRLHARSPQEAVALATRWIEAGYSVDLGIAQINSRNLSYTGLSIATAFDPCSNLAAAQKILTVNYARASREAQGLDAISRTFSLYNSGSTTRGFRNDYVARVWRAAEQIVPQLSDGGPPIAEPPKLSGSAAPAPIALDLPSFVVSPSAGSVLVFK